MHYPNKFNTDNDNLYFNPSNQNIRYPNFYFYNNNFGQNYIYNYNMPFNTYNNFKINPNNQNNSSKMPLANTNNNSYKLLFWNLLCNEYSYDWKTSPKIELKYKVWEYRSKLFAQLFSNKSIISDLYCFVEVDKQDDIYLMLNSIVNQKLFETVYYPRPSTPLGIMLLYNRIKFKLIKSYKYYLGINVNQNFALVSILQENFFPNNYFVVLITHLIARDKNEKTRIKQINKLFYNLSNDNVLKNLKINKIIFCGDLNTNPDSECIDIILGNKFKSVFDISNKEDNNYTIVIDTIDEGLKKLKFDYIFISDNIEIKNKILPINFLDFEKGLPNENFPSDHIYLFTEFQFCNKDKEVSFDFDKIIYDKSMNYELSLNNEVKNNQYIKYNINNGNIKQNEDMKNKKEKDEEQKDINTKNKEDKK